MTRVMLYEAAQVLLMRSTKWSRLTALLDPATGRCRMAIQNQIQ